MKKLFTLFVFVILAIGGMAQPAGWKYAQSYQVTENSGATLYGYQMKLYINTMTEIAAGRMSATGDDIRFGKSCSVADQPYWIEGPMNDDSTIVWVKMDTLAASSTEFLFMFYGNSGASATSSIPTVFNGPHSSTDSVASGGAGGVANSQRGFRFTSNQDVLVGSFGKREPTGTTRYVTLFSYPGGTILRQIQVSGPSAVYSYSPLDASTALAAPIWLTTGSQYLLELFQGSGDGYYFGTSSVIGGAFTYGDMRYCNSCTQNTFPTSVLSNYHYGYPDLWYYTKQTVTPAPTAVPAGTVLLADVTSPDTTLCGATPFTLSSSMSGGFTFTTCSWSPSGGLSSAVDCNPIWSGTSGSTYTLTVTDSLGCQAVDSISIAIISSPVFSVSTDSVGFCMGDSAMVMGSGDSSIVSWMWTPGSGVSDSSSSMVYLMPDSSTMYTLSVTDTNGCVGDTTVWVTVNAIPVVDFPDLSACAGDAPISLSGATPAGGTYSGPGVSAGMFDPSMTGVGTFMLNYDYSDSLGCFSSDSASAVVNALPVADFAPFGPICDIDPPVTLITGTPAGGTYSGPGVSAGVFDPGVAGVGTHALVYTYSDSAGCTASDTLMQVVDLCEALLEGSSLKAVLYPNPGDGNFVLDLPGVTGNIQVKVTNVSGQVVWKDRLQAGKHNVDLTEQPAGTYFMHIRTSGGESTIKISIRK